MAYYYFDDGFPESEDYENNYVYFNAKNSVCVEKMIKLAQTLANLPRQQRKTMFEKIQELSRL